MFARRKKSDGFEWHKYIRTAVRHRREARRERVHAAQRAAGEHLNAAGAALAAGSRAAGSAARDGAVAGAGAAGLALQALWALIVFGVRAVLRPLVALVSRPNVGVPLALAGALALGAGIGRSRGLGMDREALLTLVIGAVLMLSLLPMLPRPAGWSLPQLPALSSRAALVAGALLIVAGGAAWFASGAGFGGLAGVASLPLVGGGKSVQGRAFPVGADTLRVGTATVKLTGLDAPEAEQRCGSPARGWRCSAAAEAALSRLVGGRTVSCKMRSSPSDEASHALGQCEVGGKDIGAELVRQGHVFADGGFLARYAAQEREARAAKAGLWSGDVERPAAYRAKLWEEAKRRAPEGCPIKGQIAGATRTYVLPWSPEYDRARVQKTRGERWFCSEEEALSAGFKAAQRG
jgi:endonuclease YncB( thermonuclease family)